MEGCNSIHDPTTPNCVSMKYGCVNYSGHSSEKLSDLEVHVNTPVGPNWRSSANTGIPWAFIGILLPGLSCCRKVRFGEGRKPPRLWPFIVILSINFKDKCFNLCPEEGGILLTSWLGLYFMQMIWFCWCHWDMISTLGWRGDTKVFQKSLQWKVTFVSHVFSSLFLSLSLFFAGCIKFKMLLWSNFSFKNF